jgi:hypothetical protein
MQMHTTIDYGNSPCPAADAVNDIKEWLGMDRWDMISPEMAKVTHCGHFAMYASLTGVQGFPVKAWYELYHGQGSWKPEQLEALG